MNVQFNSNEPCVLYILTERDRFICTYRRRSTNNVRAKTDRLVRTERRPNEISIDKRNIMNERKTNRKRKRKVWKTKSLKI